MKNDKFQQKTYILENLGCANCAAKMERRIQALPDVNSASITFATRHLKVEAPNPSALKSEIQQICRSIEGEVLVTEKSEAVASTATQAAGKKGGFLSGHRTDIITLLMGIALFAAGLVLKRIWGYDTWFAGGGAAGVMILAAFAAAYILLGYKVLLTAARNISHGQIFDENFLMSIATIAAFCIGEFAEGVGVMLFYRIGELFEDMAVEKSRSQIMDAVDMRPETVMLVSGKNSESCGCGHDHEHSHHGHADCGCEHDHDHDHHDHDHAGCGCDHDHEHHEHADHDHGRDSIRVIPAGDAKIGDILLVRPGDRIPLDGIIIEGESRIDTSPVTGEPVPVSARPDTEVISGCVNVTGVLKIRVTRPLSESMVTRILDSVENAAAGKPKIDKFITRFARIYTPVVVALAVLTAVIPSLITGDWGVWVKAAITFLVISCPCALVISVPLAFFSGIGAASRLGILFKGGLAIEALKNIKAVVMDKTGTITKGVFEVDSISVFGTFTEDEVLAIAASCESASSHPVAASINSKAARMGSALSMEKPESLEEIAGMGIKADLHGKTALCGNRRLMERFGVRLPELEAASGTDILVALDGVLIGRIIISDQLKDDSVSAISRLNSMGLVPAMLTGDNAQSAGAIASSCGISEVCAGLLPEDKVTMLKKLRSKFGAVMFVGDGINDAPVLAGADVGAAMGSGADAAIEAADVVFMTSSLEAIPQSVTIARRTGRIAMQNIIFALAVKLLVILLGFIGFANIWAAVFADTGVAMLCILNSLRLLKVT